jgi:hypothetical protein
VASKVHAVHCCCSPLPLSWPSLNPFRSCRSTTSLPIQTSPCLPRRRWGGEGGSTRVCVCVSVPSETKALFGSFICSSWKISASSHYRV